MNITYLGPRARRTDPATSHAAAANARTGRAQVLRERILWALHEYGSMSAKEISDSLGEEYYSVQRRMSEIPSIHRTGEVRNGGAVWRTNRD